MNRDAFDKPDLQSGYSGDGGSEGPQEGPPIITKSRAAEDNRGKRAPQTGSGVVTGSGAGAGGAGGEEDFDSDAVGGGGTPPPIEDDHPRHGADAPVSGSR